METAKSPKSLAYARLGKPNLTKNGTAEDSNKIKRNSTGNLYEQILGQFKPDQNKYIRELVNKNQKNQEQVHHGENYHSRRKSYADLVIDGASKQKERVVEKVREERQTLCRAKYTLPEDSILQQATPKNNNSNSVFGKKIDSIGRSMNSSSNKPQIISSFKRQAKHEEKSFLDNLNCYLEQLNETPEHHSRLNYGGQKLSETLKFGGNDQNCKLASKFEQSQIKVKQLKLKLYYQDKQLKKCTKKQLKMKESLYEMLHEIKKLSTELSDQKKQRKRLERVIDNFQMKKIKPQRKTIGKLYQLKIEQLQNDLQDFTEHEQEQSQFDSSFRDCWKNATVDRKRTRHPIHIKDSEQRRGLNQDAISKLFRSKHNSDDSDYQ